MKPVYQTLCHLCLGLFIGACGLNPWPDDEGTFESNLSYDQLEFSIHPRRFVNLKDSVSVSITGMQTAFSCTKITELTVELNDSASEKNAAAFHAKIRGLFPTIPACGREKGRDTAVWADFNGLKPGLAIRLIRWPIDTAKDANPPDSTSVTYLVSGQSHRDTLVHLKNELNVTTKGSYLYRDTSALGAARLYADSLPSCAYLNWAQGKKHLDTTWIFFESISLDSAVAEWECPSEPHSDSISIQWLEGGN
jgi:hypothetical protein